MINDLVFFLHVRVQQKDISIALGFGVGKSIIVELWQLERSLVYFVSARPPIAVDIVSQVYSSRMCQFIELLAAKRHLLHPNNVSIKLVEVSLQNVLSSLIIAIRGIQDVVGRDLQLEGGSLLSAACFQLICFHYAS